MQGCVTPVVSLRRRYGLPDRDVSLGDQLIIARTPHRRVALLVDAALGVIDCPDAEFVAADEILPGLDQVEAIGKHGVGLVVMHDLDTLLSFEDEAILLAAMAGESAARA